MSSTKASTTNPQTQPQPGVIRPDELYTLDEIKKRLRLTSSAFRTARRAGLQVYYRNKHAFVYGRDWIEYVLNSAHASGPIS